MKNGSLFWVFFKMFRICLGCAILATLLWNLVRRGEAAINWEIALVFAVVFGILLTWVKIRQVKQG